MLSFSFDICYLIFLKTKQVLKSNLETSERFAIGVCCLIKKITKVTFGLAQLMSNKDTVIDTEIVVIQKSRRVGHLLACSKLVLIYLSLWHLSLIVCNLLLVLAAPFRKRPSLPMNGRHFYWFYFLVTLPLIGWMLVSIMVVRRKDNLNTFSILGLLALGLVLIDIIILCRLVVCLIVSNGINGKCQFFIHFAKCLCSIHTFLNRSHWRQVLHRSKHKSLTREQTFVFSSSLSYCDCPN